MLSEISGTDIAAIITALGVFVTTVVTALVQLRKEFGRIAEAQDSVQDQIANVQTTVSEVKDNVQTVQDTMNGGPKP